ncbi:MAG: hypothetical protein ACI4SD_04915 [Suilimivivens sp.]
MLNNNYLMFGNSIMQKYGGMISRINPLSLVFLLNEEDEEQQPAGSAQITNVQSFFYHTNHYLYNNVVNRYVQNYNQIVSVLNSNTLYADSPNFKLDILPVQLNHTTAQTTANMERAAEQVTERLLKEYFRTDHLKEQVSEVVLKQLTESKSFDSLKILPLRTRERIISEITKEVREKILPIMRKQTEQMVLTRETTKLLRQSVKTVVAQNAGKMPEPVIAETTAKMIRELTVYLTKELERVSVFNKNQTEHTVAKQIEHTVAKQTEYTVENQTEHTVAKQTEHTVAKQTEHTVEKQTENRREIINNILVRQIEPYIMALSPGTSRSVIRQEILKECRKDEAVGVLMQELEYASHTVENKTNTVRIREIIQTLIQRIAEHTDTCRKGKEKYERQIVSRLTPLPVRPVSLEFRKEQPDKEKEADGQIPAKQENQILQKKVVRILKKEQTTENQYYTHFIEQFLKRNKEKRETEIDRSSLPAGIIYHQKPKETVHFISRDVIRLPLEVLARSRNDSVREQLVKDEITGRVLSEIKNEAVIKTTEEVVHRIENQITEYQEPAERRVIHRQIPQFTAGNPAPYKPVNMMYSSFEPAVSYKAGTQELTFLVYDGQEPVGNAAQTERNVLQTERNALQIERRPAQKEPPSIPISPVSLIHKSEENGKDRQEKESSSDSIQKKEIVQPDIEFTREVVTKQNIDHVITEHIQQNQQGAATGQIPMSENPVQGIMGSQFLGQQANMMSAVNVERMISESVSRKMDDNIQEISRQVYRSLARQIKKEQERRGL